MQEREITALAPCPERRQFGRLHISEPRICQIHLPQSGEVWTDRSILVNISLGGVYFRCHRRPPLEKDDIRYVTFAAGGSDYRDHHFGFQVVVVRTEQRQLDLPRFAAALKIISHPIYCHLHPSGQSEITRLDKPRLLYEHYRLNLKAREIIANTSEIRSDKTNIMREYLDKGFYGVKSARVTQTVVNNLLLEELLHLKK
jgi:hypothetical protein